jgi:flagellar biogenesis protein FliO
MDVVRQALSVVVVFALLGFAIWRFRGRPMKLNAPRLKWFGGAARRNRALETVERLALTPQHTLHLVSIQGRRVVMATHPQGCSVLIEQLPVDSSQSVVGAGE